jgi:hypothetical protein
MTVSWLPGAGEVDCQIIEDEQKNEYGEKLWRLQHKKDYLGDPLMQITHDQFWYFQRAAIDIESYTYVIKEADAHGQGAVYGTGYRVKSDWHVFAERNFGPEVVSGIHKLENRYDADTLHEYGADFGSGVAGDSKIRDYGFDGFDGFRFNMKDWKGENRGWVVYDMNNGGHYRSQQPSRLIEMFPYAYQDYGEVWYQDVQNYAITIPQFDSIKAYKLFGEKTHAYASEIPWVDTTVIRRSGGTIRVNYKRFTGDPAPSYDIPVVIEIRDCPPYTMGQWYQSGDRWVQY